MARPNYSEMQTEVTRRLGNHAYTGFSARVQSWIASSLYYYTVKFHHPELDGEDSKRTLAESTSTVDLPADIAIPVAVALLKPGTTTIDSWLKLRDFHVIQTRFDETAGKPTLYARYGNTLYVDRNANADYPIRYFYTRIPDYPVFDSSDRSPLSEWFDEILMAKATCLGYANLWRPDLASLHQQQLADLEAAVPNRMIADDMTADRSTKSKRGQTHMGVQG